MARKWVEAMKIQKYRYAIELVKIKGIVSPLGIKGIRLIQRFCRVHTMYAIKCNCNPDVSLRILATECYSNALRKLNRIGVRFPNSQYKDRKVYYSNCNFKIFDDLKSYNESVKCISSKLT